MVKCPRCFRKDQVVKNGKTHCGKQRYLCQNCSFNFSIFTKRGKSDEVKMKALELHFEGLSFRAIGKDLNVSNVTILRWVRDARKKLRQIIKNRIELRRSQIVKLKEMDLREMWRYVSDKRKEHKSKVRLMDLV